MSNSFGDLIQKAIKDGRLNFEEKPVARMAVDDDPFPMNSAYVEAVLMPMNVVGFGEVNDKEMQD